MNVGTVHAEILANCPFSIASEYASDYLEDAGRGTKGAVLHAGPLHCRGGPARRGFPDGTRTRY